MKCRPCLTLLSTIVLSSLENVCIPRILMVCLDYIVTTSFALIRWYGCAPVHGWLDYRICLLWHRSYQCYRRTFALSSTKRQNIAAIPPTMFRRDSGKPSKCKKHFPFSVHNRNTIRIYDIVIRCYAFEPFPFFIPIYIIFFLLYFFFPSGSPVLGVPRLFNFTTSFFLSHYQHQTSSPNGFMFLASFVSA